MLFYCLKDAASCIVVSIKHFSWTDLYVHFVINIDHLPSNDQLFYNTFW